MAINCWLLLIDLQDDNTVVTVHCISVLQHFHSGHMPTLLHIVELMNVSSFEADLRESPPPYNTVFPR